MEGQKGNMNGTDRSESDHPGVDKGADGGERGWVRAFMLVEAGHYSAGFVGCALAPGVVAETYLPLGVPSCYGNTLMTRWVLGAFYLLLARNALGVRRDPEARVGGFAAGMALFFAWLLVGDVWSLTEEGEEWGPSRWCDAGLRMSLLCCYLLIIFSLRPRP